MKVIRKCFYQSAILATMLAALSNSSTEAGGTSVVIRHRNNGSVYRYHQCDGVFMNRVLDVGQQFLSQQVNLTRADSLPAAQRSIDEHKLDSINSRLTALENQLGIVRTPSDPITNRPTFPTVSPSILAPSGAGAPNFYPQ